jgi:hypothetical protein
VSPSEIAFLALGLVLGAAIGAALVQAIRARPAPRREVRITVSPNSIAPRRASTLSSADPGSGRDLIPGSPADDGWLERRLAGASGVVDRVAQPSGTPPPNRTRVPSCPVPVPSTAVAIPVGAGDAMGGYGVPGRLVGPGPGADMLSASIARPVITTAVLDPVAPPVSRERPAAEPRPALPALLDRGRSGTDVAVRPRLPTPFSRAILPSTAVAVPMGHRAQVPARPPAAPTRIAFVLDLPRAAREIPAGLRQETPAGRDAARHPIAPASPAGTEACEAERHIVHERSLLSDAAREQARLAAHALRDAQREYDILRDRVERAQVTADPREIGAAKDAAHRAFRAPPAAATPEAAENAAREWLNEINRLNTAAREAAHVAETGMVELRAQLPRLERLAVEADAARITAESAEAGCNEAREALAQCEEQAALARSAAAAAARAPEVAPSVLDDAWPTERETRLRPAAGVASPHGDLAAVVRILRGDRPARERLVVTLAGGDAGATRQWHLRIAGLVDAIGARAVEDGYLDLPREGFWGLFSHHELRDIVAALSALGFRFDGLGGFADGRVPAPRDLSLAVGYAGLDPMRIRIWPREAELPTLYAGAIVAADEWLAVEAGDLSLGRMVDALGARAAELADIWNAWGRVRPALLATD